MWRSNSCRERTTSSAAAEGVGARRSATKSAIVKSASWPMPVMIGISDAAIARATTSSLNAQRSSSEPPPRADDEHVCKFRAIEIIHGRCDFLRGAFTLHFHGIEAHVRIGKAALQHAQNVANRRARGRRDDADAQRQNWERLFARFVEEAFVLQTFFQLLEGELQSAEADRLDIRDIDLIFAAHVVDAERRRAR